MSDLFGDFSLSSPGSFNDTNIAFLNDAADKTVISKKNKQIVLVHPRVNIYALTRNFGVEIILRDNIISKRKFSFIEIKVAYIFYSLSF